MKISFTELKHNTDERNYVWNTNTAKVTLLIFEICFLINFITIPSTT